MMSAHKRRKIDAKAAKPTISAFAARRALKGNISGPERVSRTIGDEHSLRLKTSREEFTTPHVTKPDVKIASTSVAVEDGGYNTTNIDTRLLPEEEDSDVFVTQEYVEVVDLPIHKPPVIFSTFNPGEDNVKALGNGKTYVRIAPGERLVVLGLFDLSVVKGQVTVSGAVLRASAALNRVYAPASHAIPVIRHAASDIEYSEVCLHSCDSGLVNLQELSPLFSRLWSDGQSSANIEQTNFAEDSSKHSYQILFSSSEKTERGYLQPLISLPEWNVTLSRISEANTSYGRAVFICGPKSSGKSTFTRILSNRLVSDVRNDRGKLTEKLNEGILILDLDPGQPEYSPPGQLSLIYVEQVNFGVPYTHSVPGSHNRVIRSHSIGAISPAADSSLYIACALDLFNHYRHFLSMQPYCPLIINTPGWVLGTGLEILVELIEKFRPSDIIYMSQDGPEEAVESLREAAKTTPLVTLPSQVTEFANRTAAHLRTMQYMSYFHVHGHDKEHLRWDARPLSTLPPLEIQYAERCSGILGILCYGEQPPPSLLAETINGTLVSVVVVDDMSAIPGWTQANNSKADGVLLFDTTDDDYLEEQSLLEAYTQPEEVIQPIIARTPKEDLPYFNPANSIILDPAKSHSVGLALVRGIDVARRRIQILTPINAQVVEDARRDGKSVILLSGQLDTPGWAYTEVLYQQSGREKKTALGDDEFLSVDIEEDGSDREKEDELDQLAEELPGVSDVLPSVPWIQRLEGSRGRGIGSRVWRVRRDLGKNHDGTE